MIGDDDFLLLESELAYEQKTITSLVNCAAFVKGELIGVQKTFKQIIKL